MTDKPQGAFGYQDPQGLSRGVPQTAFGIQDALRMVKDGARQAVQPVGWALHYPDRLLERFGLLQQSAPPKQMDPSYQLMRQIGEERWEPGQRESLNVEDYRPKSPWQFW